MQAKITHDIHRIHVQKSPTTPGWTAEYFNNKTASDTPVTTRVEQEISNPWEKKAVSGIGSTNFSVVWTAYLKPTYSGKYTFMLTDGRKFV